MHRAAGASRASSRCLRAGRGASSLRQRSTTGGAEGEGALGRFLRHGSVTQRLVTTGVAAGETVELGEVEGRISVVGETVILRADVIGDAAKESLLSISP